MDSKTHRSWVRLLFIGWYGLLVAAGCAAQQPVQQPAATATGSTDPELNSRFYDADPADWAQRFEGESREIYRQRNSIVAASGAASGMTVADVGAGTGLFTMLFARQVGPGGRVIAVDISKPFLASIAKRAAEAGQKNVSTLLGTHTDVRLPAGSVDIVFTSDTYHHFEQPVPVLASIRQALKPGGRLIVIDFERIPGVSAPSTLEHVRAGKETVINEINAAGFRLLGEVTNAGLKQNYYLIFEKI